MIFDGHAWINSQLQYNHSLKQIQTLSPSMANSLPLIIITLLLSYTSSRVVYPEGLWPMNSFGQFSTQSQQILSYYDFDRDRFVDILTCAYGATNQLRVYLWSQLMRTFRMVSSVDLGPFRPLTVIPVDIIRSNELELVITLKLDVNQQVAKMYIYSISCQNQNCTIKNNEQIQTQDTATNPTVMQLQGRNIIVFNQDNQLTTITYQRDANNTQKQSNFVQQYFISPTDQLKSTVCANYLNIFYVDYNGDCLQDLIIHCNPAAGMADLQFYKGNQKGQFKTDSRARVGAGLFLLNVAIADINFDGLVDVVQLIKNGVGQLFLQIHYNTAIKQKYKRCQITIHHKTQNYFPYHFITSQSQFSQQDILLIQRVSLQKNQQWSGTRLEPKNFILRPGDINNDGFMDLIIDGPNRASLYINQQCLVENCGTYNPKFMEQWSLGKIRVFRLREIDGMRNYNGKICKMSFFDIHEDGRLDLFASICPIDNFETERIGTILAIYNSLPIDAFFNLQFEKIMSKTMDKKLNVYGAHADFFVTALNGERIPACGTQLGHPGLSLQLPYIHSGLGRTNNYIQQITVTISNKQSPTTKTWTPIVPNSQLIIVPGPKWILQTYISPTSITAIVFWFVVVILVLIGFWIMRLTRLEKIEDKENQDSFYTILR